MRRRLLLICLLVAGAVTVIAPLRADERKAGKDAEKVKAIRELIVVTGTAKMASQVIDQLIGAFRQQGTNVPDEFWTKMREKFKSESGELMDKLVPIYDKYYTRQDVDGLIAFYKSPLGRKVTTTMPLVMHDSMVAGEQWGRKVAEQVIAEMKRQGYSPPH